MKGDGTPLRLVVDARGVGRSGIGRYTHVVIEELLRDDRFSELHLLGDPSELNTYRDGRKRVRVSDISTGFYSPRFQIEWAIRRMRRDFTADVFFFPHYDAPIRLPPRSVVVVHDLIHFALPDIFPLLKRAGASVLLRRVVERAAHVVVPSYSTRTDLGRRIPSSAGRTSVVPLGLDPAFLQEKRPSADSAAHAESLAPFLLCVGNRKPHKNLIAAVESLALVRRSIPAMRLVIAGGRYPGWESVSRRADQLGVADAVVELESPSDGLLHALYERCFCLLFLSLYEGLGLPVLEAFARRAPVIASNRSSLPEVVADAGILVDPTSADDIAAAVLRLHLEPSLRERLIQAGKTRVRSFDWAGAASGIADLLWEVGRAEAASLRQGGVHPIDLWPMGAERPDSTSKGAERIPSPTE